MNPKAQTARHVAIRSAEKRLDDLELLVTGLAEDLRVFNVNLGAYACREAGRLDAVDQMQATRLDGVAVRLDAFTQQTFWPRLRWLLGF